jgi:ElaB/YqjD/DUF883 family membrane-anchored ribosome-binding protein
MASNIHAAKDQLAQDLKAVVADSEILLREVGTELSERGKQARARLAATVESCKASYGQLQEKTKAGARVADEYIHDNPYRVIGIALGVGLIVGLLATRK